MNIVLYDLIGADDRRFSPFCWRTRMALAHKGLDFDTRPTRFTEISSIADGQQKTVPVIDDGGRIVSDSWTIAAYLEEAYPDRPSLFAGDGGRSLTVFVQRWVDSVLHMGLARLLMKDIHDHVTPEDQPYFRQNREQRFGRSLEAFVADRDVRVEELRRNLQPLRLTLKEQPFLGGDRPLYGDYLVFGGFQFAASMSPFKVLADDDPLRAWIERCRDLYDGLGRSTTMFQ